MRPTNTSPTSDYLAKSCSHSLGILNKSTTTAGAVSKGEGRARNFVHHNSSAPSRETSISLSSEVIPFTCLPSEDISQVSAKSSTPDFGTSKDTLKSTRNTKLLHNQPKRSDNNEMSSLQTNSVAGSPSQSTLPNYAPPNHRKRPLSPVTPLPPKRARATGPFADSDDSDDDAPKVAAPPKRPILNLQRLKQAIAKNNQDARNAKGQTFVGKEGLAKLKHGASSQVPKKNDGKDQQLRTPVAGMRKTVIDPSNNVAKAGISGKQEAILNKAQYPSHPVETVRISQSKPPSYQAGMKVASVPRAPRVNGEIVNKPGNLSAAKAKSAGTPPAASYQPAKQKSVNKPASVGLTQARKTPLQTEEMKKAGVNVQVAGQPKPAQMLATGPPIATAKQQNSHQNYDAKRPSSPTVPIPTKKQKTGNVLATKSVTTPGTSSVNTPNIPKRIPAQSEKTLVTPNKTPAELGKIPSPFSPTSSVTNKTQLATPKAPPLVRSATPTLLKQSNVVPTPKPSGPKLAITTPSSPPKTQEPVIVPKPAQITSKGNVNIPQAGSFIPKNALASAPAARAVLPSSRQSTSAQAVPLSLKRVSATPKVTPSTTKVVEPAKLAQVPKSSPVAPATLKAASIFQAGSDSRKTKDVASRETTASKAASIAPQTASISQKKAQISPKSSPQKGSPYQAVINKVTPITTKLPPKETHLIGKEVPMIQNEAEIALKGSSTPPEISPLVQEVNLALPRSANEPASSATTTAETRKEPPFFEYTVFQKTFPASGEDNSTPSVQIATFTDIDNANAQAENLQLAASHQHPLVYNIQYSSWNIKPDAFNCMSYLGTFAPIEYPTHKSYVKIWVERHPASAHTDRGASAKTHFLAKTVFILRLCKLIEPDSDDEAMEDSDSEDEEPMRVFQALPEGHAELYTTLDAANRAARRLQIEMSHEKEPKYPSKRMWQEKDAKDLYNKVADLEKKKGYWESQFNEVRLGGDKFELVVEQARLFGPRNL